MVFEFAFFCRRLKTVLKPRNPVGLRWTRRKAPIFWIRLHFPSIPFRSKPSIFRYLVGQWDNSRIFRYLVGTKNYAPLFSITWLVRSCCLGISHFPRESGKIELGTELWTSPLALGSFRVLISCLKGRKGARSPTWNVPSKLGDTSTPARRGFQFLASKVLFSE